MAKHGAKAAKPKAATLSKALRADMRSLVENHSLDGDLARMTAVPDAANLVCPPGQRPVQFTYVNEQGKTVNVTVCIPV